MIRDMVFFFGSRRTKEGWDGGRVEVGWLSPFHPVLTRFRFESDSARTVSVGIGSGVPGPIPFDGLHATSSCATILFFLCLLGLKMIVLETSAVLEKLDLDVLSVHGVIYANNGFGWVTFHPIWT